MAATNLFLGDTRRRLRISVRAVVAGALVQLALIGLLMALARGMGWRFGFAEQQLGAKLAVYGIAVWVVSAFIGGYTAAVVSRSADRRDGLAHGLVTWAIAILAAMIAARVWMVLALAVHLAEVDTFQAFDTPRVMLAFVLADALALIAAIAGGIAGSRAERRLETGAPSVQGPSVEWRPGEPHPAS
jgi:hypothetical protein